MTSPEPSRSISALGKTSVAFAVERQALVPELASAIEDKERIAAGLLLCLSFLVGQTLADVKIEGLDRIYPAKRNQGTIDFKIVCRLPTKIQVHLGVCVLTTPDFEAATEVCTRLLVYKDFRLDRLCLLRQSNLMTNVYQLPTCLPKLLSRDIGGHYVPLKPRDLLTILATLSVFQHRQQHEISNESLYKYLQQEELLTKNDLITNILTAARS
jgi:hypothetical protein